MSSNKDTKFAYISENKGTGDLKIKSDVELKELLDRQDHLLSNKSLVNKLKDTGEKIRLVRNKIAQELEARSVKNNVTNKKPIKNSTAVEWKDLKTPRKNAGECDTSDIEDKLDGLKILSEHGQVLKHEKSHITRLVEMEKDPDFSYKPYNSVVDEKIKKIVPEAHTSSVTSLVKTIHLEESLNLLTQQMSALKVLGTRSKRVVECIENITNESAQDDEHVEEIDDDETKVGLGVSVNINFQNED